MAAIQLAERCTIYTALTILRIYFHQQRRTHRIVSRTVLLVILQQRM